jgi:hypothetical protein
MRPNIPSPILSDACPAGGDHNWSQWSGKTRCTKCGTTQ